MNDPIESSAVTLVEGLLKIIAIPFHLIKFVVKIITAFGKFWYEEGLRKGG